MVIGDLDGSNGLDFVENILIPNDNELEDINSVIEKRNVEGNLVFHNFKFSHLFTEHSDRVAIFNFINTPLVKDPIGNHLELMVDEETLEIPNEEKISLEINQIVVVDDELNLKELMDLYKTLIHTSMDFFNDKRFPDHIKESFKLNEFVAVACKCNDKDLFDHKPLNERFKIIEAELLTGLDLSNSIMLPRLQIDFGILDYIYSKNVTIKDLVDAGMDLLVGVEETEELREKLKNQILLSLADINVIALITAAIRTEEDFLYYRVREVDIEADPAFLYTDEVLGLAIANQIAGTKGTFNFKRYDEEKPGILAYLDPMSDDIFAGLIAGAMSKIFDYH
ncbi:MAG: phosphatidylglycerophosphatase A [Methanobrevibacter sp.]|nr:phosphatidylglycerophosphatase A [Methanobrevibacter sp.]